MPYEAQHYNIEIDANKSLGVAGLPVVLPTNSCYQKYEVLALLTIAW